MKIEIEFIAALFGKHNLKWLKTFLDNKEMDRHLQRLANFLNQHFGLKLKLSFEKYKKEHNYVDLEPILKTMRIYDLNCKTLFVNMGISIDNLLTYDEMIDQVEYKLSVLSRQIKKDTESIASTTEGYQTQAERNQYCRNISDNLKLLYGSRDIEHHLKFKKPHKQTPYESCLEYIDGKVKYACTFIELKLKPNRISEKTLNQIHKIYSGLKLLVAENIFGYSEQDSKKARQRVCVCSFAFFIVIFLFLVFC